MGHPHTRLKPVAHAAWFETELPDLAPMLRTTPKPAPKAIRLAARYFGSVSISVSREPAKSGAAPDFPVREPLFESGNKVDDRSMRRIFLAQGSQCLLALAFDQL